MALIEVFAWIGDALPEKNVYGWLNDCSIKSHLSSIQDLSSHAERASHQDILVKLLVDICILFCLLFLFV